MYSHSEELRTTLADLWSRVVEECPSILRNEDKYLTQDPGNKLAILFTIKNSVKLTKGIQKDLESLLDANCKYIATFIGEDRECINHAFAQPSVICRRCERK